MKGRKLERMKRGRNSERERKRRKIEFMVWIW